MRDEHVDSAKPEKVKPEKTKVIKLDMTLEEFAQFCVIIRGDDPADDTNIKAQIARLDAATKDLNKAVKTSR